MKVYNHKDAYLQLNKLIQSDDGGCFISVFTETAVHYGIEKGFSLQKAKEKNIPCFDIQKGGGAMVTSPGDVVYCYMSTQKMETLNIDLRLFLEDKLNKKNLFTKQTKNDLLVNGKKISGFMDTYINGKYFYGGHISLDCNLPLIKEICIKPMEKTPGGLSEYGITTEEVVE